MNSFWVTYWCVCGIIAVWLVWLSWSDCRCRRLPNYLTLPGWIVFPVLWGLWQGWGALGNSFLGGLVGAAFLIIPYLLRGAGAGDVKMLFAVGCLTRFPGVLMTLVITSIAGLVLGVVMMVLGRTDSARLKHYIRCCVDIRYDKVAGRAALPPKKSEKVRIPYGVAIAIGALGNMLWTAYVLLQKGV